MLRLEDSQDGEQRNEYQVQCETEAPAGFDCTAEDIHDGLSDVKIPVLIPVGAEAALGDDLAGFDVGSDERAFYH